MRWRPRRKDLKPADKICMIDPGRLDGSLIEHAARIIGRGGVVVFPTHGLYGIGVDARNARAVERVFCVKGRARDNPLLALVADLDAVEELAPRPGEAARHLMRAFWPGRVTFVIPAHAQIIGHLTGGRHCIGVRVPGHPVAAALVRAAGGPITGTSANLSGTGGCASVSQLDPEVIEGADMVLDAGPLAGGPGSTVVDMCGDAPVILRMGSVPGEKIMACHRRYLRKRIDIDT